MNVVKLGLGHAVLSIACLGLLGLSVKTLWRPVPTRVQLLENMSQPAQPDATRMTSFSAPPLSSYKAVLAAPIFSPLRSPAATRNDAKSAGNPARLTQFKLQGILIDDIQRSALFYSRLRGESLALRLGEKLDGWTVTDISAQSVRMKKAGQSRLLRLSLDALENSPGSAKSRRANSTSRSKSSRTPSGTRRVDGAALILEADG